LAVNFNISDKELKTQIALGTAKEYLNTEFILSRKDPEIIAILSKLWSTTPLPKSEIFLIADTLIGHPYIRKIDRDFVIRMRNTYLNMCINIQKMLENFKKN